MKYIKKFANMSEYQAFTEGGGVYNSKSMPLNRY